MVTIYVTMKSEMWLLMREQRLKWHLLRS